MVASKTLFVCHMNSRTYSQALVPIAVSGSAVVPHKKCRAECPSSAAAQLPVALILQHESALVAQFANSDSATPRILSVAHTDEQQLSTDVQKVLRQSALTTVYSDALVARDAKQQRALILVRDSQHVCRPETCQYMSADSLYEKAIQMLDSGVAQRTRPCDIYVCPISGTLHVCTDEACECLTFAPYGSTFMCWKTGNSHGVISIQCDSTVGSFDSADSFAGGSSAAGEGNMRSSTFAYGHIKYMEHANKKLQERINAAKQVWIKTGDGCPVIADIEAREKRMNTEAQKDSGALDAARERRAETLLSSGVLQDPVRQDCTVAAHNNGCQCYECYPGGRSAMLLRATSVVRTLILDLPRVARPMSSKGVPRMTHKSMVAENYMHNAIPPMIAHAAAERISAALVDLWRAVTHILLNEQNNTSESVDEAPPDTNADNKRPAESNPGRRHRPKEKTHRKRSVFMQFDKFIIGAVYLGANGCCTVVCRDPDSTNVQMSGTCMQPPKAPDAQSTDNMVVLHSSKHTQSVNQNLVELLKLTMNAVTHNTGLYRRFADLQNATITLINPLFETVSDDQKEQSAQVVVGETPLDTVQSPAACACSSTPLSVSQCRFTPVSLCLIEGIRVTDNGCAIYIDGAVVKNSINAVRDMLDRTIARLYARCIDLYMKTMSSDTSELCTACESAVQQTHKLFTMFTQSQEK